MTEQSDIVAKLDELAEVKAAVAVTQSEYETKRAELLKQIQEELDALQAEYQPLLDTANARVSALEAEIRDEVLSAGASVKGRLIHAVYTHGRITWDTKALDNYAVEHPEVVQFRRQGQPSVSLRLSK